jgi:ketopantoate reductase
MAAAQGKPTPAVNRCVDLFRDIGVDCKSEESLDSVLWKKLCWNIPFNGLSICGRNNHGQNYAELLTYAYVPMN